MLRPPVLVVAPFNALEQLLIPRLPGEAGGQQALEERAREDAVRLMRFRGQRR